MQSLLRLVARLNALALALCFVVVLLLVGHVTLEVVMRYVFERPLKGTIQFVSLYYMVAITFLALGAVEQRGAHISVEVLAGLMPRRLRLVSGALGALMGLGVAGALMVRSWHEALAQARTGAFVMEGGFSLPTWPTYFFVPIGFALLLVAALARLLALGTGRGGLLAGAGFDPGAPVLDPGAGEGVPLDIAAPPADSAGAGRREPRA